jgi:hypothetical protein
VNRKSGGSATRHLPKTKYFMLRPFSILFLFLSAILILGACQSDSASQKSNPAPPKSVQVPRFDSDSAYAFISRQVDFGPRVPNSVGHARTRDWLIAKLESFGAEVVRQDFHDRYR